MKSILVNLLVKIPLFWKLVFQKGGSLDMWNYYFDNKCSIYGIDVDPNCKLLEKEYNDNVKIFIGDQGDPAFWDNFISKNNIEFDIIIDDGGHTMNQQIVSYKKLYDRVKEGGVYLCEDTHTSYYPKYGGDYKKNNTFIEYSKNFVDFINAYHINPVHNISLNFRKKTFCISYYDSIVVLDKKTDNEVPTAPMMK